MAECTVSSIRTHQVVGERAWGTTVISFTASLTTMDPREGGNDSAELDLTEEEMNSLLQKGFDAEQFEQDCIDQAWEAVNAGEQLKDAYRMEVMPVQFGDYEVLVPYKHFAEDTTRTWRSKRAGILELLEEVASQFEFKVVAGV